jgi:hypothetical protein
MEVEFFVIVENSKGKMSDRAVHLQVLPTGTVEFEATVAENVLATVIAEAKAHPREEPGILRLQHPIKLGPGKPDLAAIELWQRCLPEGLLCKVGDILKLDVQNYRPEKLFFARSVKVEKFRSLGRETGVVCSVREHFGFVKSNIRDVDIYFRTSEVIDEKGGVLPENQVKEGLEVSFDVTIEDMGGRGGGGGGERGGDRGSGGGGSQARLRAVRVNKLSSSIGSSSNDATGGKNGSGSQSSTDNEGGGGVAAVTAGVAQVSLLSHSSSLASTSSVSSSVNVLRTGLKGIVLRDAKRDAPGLIKVSLTAIAAAEGALGNGPHGGVEELERNYPEVVEALKEFQTTSELTEVVLESVPSFLRKVYHTILNERFQGIAHESLVSIATPQSTNAGGGAGGNVAMAVRDPGKGRPLRLWKLNEADYAAWLLQSQTQTQHSKGGSTTVTGSASSSIATEGVAAAAGAAGGIGVNLGVDASTGRKIVDMREQGGMNANSSGSKHLTNTTFNNNNGNSGSSEGGSHGGRDHHNNNNRDKDHKDHHDREKQDKSQAHAHEYEEILFHRTDTSDEFGPIAKDLEVLFDLCFDKKTNKKIAKNVRLTDEPIPGLQGDNYGILDVVVSRNGKFGFIRCIPTDEKLFWHSTGAAPGANQADLSEGREVIEVK